MNFPVFSVINIGLDPVLFRLGPLSVHWYGLAYVAGLALGMYVAVPYAESRGIPRDSANSLFWPILIACLVGGRLYYVVQSDFGWYLQHPQNILATWEGGMAFYGAVFLGAPTAYVLCRVRKIPFPIVLDAAALFIPIAQSVGRIGNIVNGDIVGYPSTEGWATRYTNAHNTFVASHTVAYQPAAVYELIFSLALFGLLWRFRSSFRVPGTLFIVWLLTYAAGQFMLFFARDNTVVALGLKQAQWTSLVVIAVMLPVWYIWQRHVEEQAERPAELGRPASGATAP